VPVRPISMNRGEGKGETRCPQSRLCPPSSEGKGDECNGLAHSAREGRKMREKKSSSIPFCDGGQRGATIPFVSLYPSYELKKKRGKKPKRQGKGEKEKISPRSKRPTLRKGERTRDLRVTRCQPLRKKKEKG